MTEHADPSKTPAETSSRRLPNFNINWSSSDRSLIIVGFEEIGNFATHTIFYDCSTLFLNFASQARSSQDRTSVWQTKWPIIIAPWISTLWVLHRGHRGSLCSARQRVVRVHQRTQVRILQKCDTDILNCITRCILTLERAVVRSGPPALQHSTEFPTTMRAWRAFIQEDSRTKVRMSTVAPVHSMNETGRWHGQVVCRRCAKTRNP